MFNRSQQSHVTLVHRNSGIEFNPVGARVNFNGASCHVRHSGRMTLRVGGEARSRVRDAGRLSHVDQGGIRSGKREREQLRSGGAQGRKVGAPPRNHAQSQQIEY